MPAGADGLLVEPESPAALAAGIARLLGDAGLRAQLIAGGRAKLGRDFDEERLLAAVEKVPVPVSVAMQISDADAEVLESGPNQCAIA